MHVFLKKLCQPHRKPRPENTKEVKLRTLAAPCIIIVASRQTEKHDAEINLLILNLIGCYNKEFSFKHKYQCLKCLTVIIVIFAAILCFE